MMITLVYISADRLRKRRTFKTLAGARRFAHKWVGTHPDISSMGYAVSFDGLGTIWFEGVSPADLFPS